MAGHTTVKRGSITAAGLARLLERLHPDAEAAAREYERLRVTLARYFEWRGGSPADECADEVLDRLARRLEEGAAIDEVRGYARGIARHVLLERRRDPKITSLDPVALPIEAVPVADAADAVRRDCLDTCLAGLTPQAQSLLLAYYQGERFVKIANRRRLAAGLGLSDNALRSRVQRLRDRVGSCVQACVTARGERV